MGGSFRKLPVLGAFLAGVAFGIGITVVSLYAQKPGCLVVPLESIAAAGRARREKEEEKGLLRNKLRAMGFSEQEINENL